jgi:hypothetical protein
MEWVGDLEHFTELKDAWIQIEGIPPKSCDCKVFAQVVSGFGLMIEVDWASMFKSFYEKIRVRVACRKPAKIPTERLFEMDKKLHLLSIFVEGYEQEAGEKPSEDDDDDDLGDEGDEAQDEGIDELDDKRNMETDGPVEQADNFTTLNQKSAPTGAKTVMMVVDLDVQTLADIAHLYSKQKQEEDSGQDSEQLLRCKEFLENSCTLKQKGDVLLSSMEMVDEVSEKRQDGMEVKTGKFTTPNQN